MHHRALVFILLVVIFPSFAPATTLPLICDPSTKKKIRPYLTKLKDKTRPNILKDLKKIAARELIEFDSGYRSFISGMFLKPKHMDQNLIDLYRSVGINNGEDIIQDLLEGIWTDGNLKKCNSIQRRLVPIDQSKIEDVTTPKVDTDK